MQRRDFLSRSVGASALAIFAGALAPTGSRAADTKAASTLTPLQPRDEIRVAFMLGDRANVIDTAGPWEVFQDTMPDSGQHKGFELYTVAPKADVVRMTGGLRVQPHYTIENAPQPHVIVVPAQRSTPESLEWLRSASAGTDVTLSVCTGAFQLARAGLLKDVPATTHHQFWDAFSKEFPQIELRRGLRFVDSGRIATAGGLTSGIDMALHIVARYFGVATAQRTAAYMEYRSEDWKTPA